MNSVDNTSRCSGRGIAPVVGVGLLLLITVALSGVTFAMVSDINSPEPVPVVQLEASVDDGALVLTHVAGDTLQGEDLVIEGYDVDVEAFSSTETIVLDDKPNSGTTAEVTVVYERSSDGTSHLLLDDEVDIPPSGSHTSGATDEGTSSDDHESDEDDANEDDAIEDDANEDDANEDDTDEDQTDEDSAEDDDADNEGGNEDGTNEDDADEDGADEDDANEDDESDGDESNEEVGEECPEGVICIYDVNDLQNVSDDLDADYLVMNDIDATETDDWNYGAGFDPIGDATDPFSGTLDGDGHEIVGLTVDRPESDKASLFGYVSGEISDLDVREFSITGAGAGFGFDVGGPAPLAAANNGTISSVTSIDATVRGDSKVSGLVAHQEAGGHIYDSSVVNADLAGNYGIGGLVAHNEGEILRSSSGGHIERTSTFNTVGTAGLVAQNDQGYIRDSYATTVVETPSFDSAQGGLVGINRNGVIQTSFAAGEVVAPNTDAGGLVGSDSGLLVDSYWNVNATNQTESDGGTPLSDSDMLGDTATESMEEFDFDTVWKAIEDGYPELRE